MMARSRRRSSELGALRMSSTIWAVMYSRPMVGVTSSNVNAVSRAPLFFRGPVFLLLVAFSSLGGE